GADDLAAVDDQLDVIDAAVVRGGHARDELRLHRLARRWRLDRDHRRRRRARAEHAEDVVVRALHAAGARAGPRLTLATRRGCGLEALGEVALQVRQRIARVQLVLETEAVRDLLRRRPAQRVG